jgi:hypothetical protein
MIHDSARAEAGCRRAPLARLAAGAILPLLVVAAAASGAFAAGPVTIHASLVGPDGKVVAVDCSYSVTKYGGDYTLPRLPLKKGEFEFTAPPGNYSLHVINLLPQGYYVKNYVDFKINEAGPNPPLVVPVLRAAPLDILVKDAFTQKPLAGQPMTVWYFGGGDLLWADAQGKARMMVPPGLVKITADGSGLYEAVGDHPVTVGEEGAATTLELVPYVELKGQVAAASGKPVTKVWAEVWTAAKGTWYGRTHSPKVSGAGFVDIHMSLGPCLVVVGADGLAPTINPLVLTADGERKYIRNYTLEEGIEVTLEMSTARELMPLGYTRGIPEVPTVVVIDAKFGVPVLQVPMIEYGTKADDKATLTKKVRLMPGRYTLACFLPPRYFVAQELDLKAPQTVKVEAKSAAQFDRQVADLLKNIRFPEKP